MRANDHDARPFARRKRERHDSWQDRSTSRGQDRDRSRARVGRRRRRDRLRRNDARSEDVHRLRQGVLVRRSESDPTQTLGIDLQGASVVAPSGLLDSNGNGRMDDDSARRRRAARRVDLEALGRREPRLVSKATGPARRPDAAPDRFPEAAPEEAAAAASAALTRRARRSERTARACCGERGHLCEVMAAVPGVDADVLIEADRSGRRMHEFAAKLGRPQGAEQQDPPAVQDL